MTRDNYIERRFVASRKMAEAAGHAHRRQGQRFSRSEIIMSSGRFVFPRSLFSLSLSRLHSRREKRGDTQSRTDTNENDVPSGRRESPATCREPTPRILYSLHHSALRWYYCPKISRRFPDAEGRERWILRSLLRTHCEPSNTQRGTQHRSNYLLLLDYPSFSFIFSFSFPQSDKSTKISLRSCLTTYFFQSNQIMWFYK